jgi:hypothetical protein
MTQPKVKRNANEIMKSMKKTLAPIHPTAQQLDSDIVSPRLMRQ